MADFSFEDWCYVGVIVGAIIWAGYVVYCTLPTTPDKDDYDR